METINDPRQHPPTLWSASAICQLNDQSLMYVFGGAPVTKTKEVTGISCYDLKKKQWQPARSDDAKLPFVTGERWGHSATVCPQESSNIYLIGGWDNRCQYGDTLLFDAKTNRLSLLDGTEIDPRAGHTAVCIGTSIYLFGGAICKGGPYKFYNDLQVFDSKKKVWSEVKIEADKPPPRSQHSSIALGDNFLLILGGYTGGSLLDDVWCLDIKESKWKRMLITSEERGPKGWSGLSTNDFRVRPSAHTSVLLRWSSGVGIILVSGFCGSDQTYVLHVRPKLGTMEWIRLKSNLVSITGHSFVSAPLNGGLTVATFGGSVNEKDGEPGVGRVNSYLRTFDVV